MGETPEVELVGEGRTGTVRYREGANEHLFDWELGGRGALFVVYVPNAAGWDRTIPWAAGRRAEVLKALGTELCLQHCPECGVEISSEGWLNITDPPRTVGRVAREVAWLFLLFGSLGALALALLGVAVGAREYPGFTGAGLRFFLRDVLPPALAGGLGLAVVLDRRAATWLRVAALAAGLWLLVTAAPGALRLGPPATMASALAGICLVVGAAAALVPRRR